MLQGLSIGIAVDAAKLHSAKCVCWSFDVEPAPYAGADDLTAVDDLDDGGDAPLKLSVGQIAACGQSGARGVRQKARTVLRHAVDACHQALVERDVEADDLARQFDPHQYARRFVDLGTDRNVAQIARQIEWFAMERRHLDMRRQGVFGVEERLLLGATRRYAAGKVGKEGPT